MSFDDHLYDWSELQDEPWQALLLGNGFSQAVWPSFGYSSLFEVAVDALEPGLQQVDVDLFADLNVDHNFERVLGSLRTAEIVAAALGVDSPLFGDRYTSIQGALVQAVREVHVPYSLLEIEALQEIREGLTRFDRVFTTNYDLLPYWAAMVDPPSEGGWSRRIVDFLWGPECSFDERDVDVRDNAVHLYFVHGGLHIRRTVALQTRKAVAEGFHGLMDVMNLSTDEAWPLFVSEGSAEAKVESIRSSDYLSFCLRSLAGASEPLVIFGHSLSPEDQHLVDALNRNERRVAVSLYRPEDQSSEMHRIKSKLSRQDLRFFDGASFPLGLEGLRVEVGMP